MSVTTTATSVSYIYQEGEVYSLPYEYQNEADVKASYIDSDGNKVNLAYNVDYTVGGSTVTLIAALPDGVTITFSRQTEITQQTELPAQPITKAIEEAIDRNTMCIQEATAAQQVLKLDFEETVNELNNKYNNFVDEVDEIVNHANVYVPTVDSDGNLSWANEGDCQTRQRSISKVIREMMASLGRLVLKGLPGPQGVPGQDGEQGIQGIPGKDGRDGEQGRREHPE